MVVMAWTTSFACAKPAQVILIRHAEKPPEGNGLSPKGVERAAALAPFFMSRPEVLQFKTPVAIYAQKSTKGRPSERPVQTVQPLADALKLTVQTFAHNDFATMVDEINAKPEYEGKMVLIAWEHNALVDIARQFGAKDAPNDWPGKSFDRCWVITFPKDGKPTFRNLPQKLMFGDSAD